MSTHTHETGLKRKISFGSPYRSKSIRLEGGHYRPNGNHYRPYPNNELVRPNPQRDNYRPTPLSTVELRYDDVPSTSIEINYRAAPSSPLPKRISSQRDKSRPTLLSTIAPISCADLPLSPVHKRVSPTYSPMLTNFPVDISFNKADASRLTWYSDAMSLASPYSSVIEQKERFSKLPREEFKLGLIFRAPHHEQHLNPFSSYPGDAARTESHAGPICTKTRKMIVVALHAEHYIAIPMFTHNGNGLSFKANPNDYVSVFDHRSLHLPHKKHPTTTITDNCLPSHNSQAEPSSLSVSPPENKPLSAIPPLWTGVMRDSARLLDVKSTAHFTYPVSRYYKLPIIVEGELGLESVFALIELYARETVAYTNAMRMMREQLAIDRARREGEVFVG